MGNPVLLKKKKIYIYILISIDFTVDYAWRSGGQFTLTIQLLKPIILSCLEKVCSLPKDSFQL